MTCCSTSSLILTLTPTTSRQFPDLAIEAYTHEGGIYGMPDNVASIAIFYNQDLFEEAGAMTAHRPVG